MLLHRTPCDLQTMPHYKRPAIATMDLPIWSNTEQCYLCWWAATMHMHCSQ